MEQSLKTRLSFRVYLSLGSVLRLVLSLVFNNGLPVKTVCQVMLFVDATLIYQTSKCSHEIPGELGSS